jgi:PTS system mannose-specific IID component
MGFIVLLALQLGAGVMKEFLDMIPAWVQSGLQVAGNMLPALGFALLMNLMLNKKVAPYFFLGFMLAAYLKLPIIAIGGLGVIIALIITQTTTPQNTDIDEATEETTTEAVAVQKLTKGDIRSMFFRSLTLEANFNFETWQNTGFAFSIIPALKRLYTNKEDMAKALKRHLQLFNTSPYGSTLVFGITAAMEEQNSLDPDFDDESISSVKLGLMGPLAGVFDSLFWGTFKVIAAGVGTSLAIKGNILGPVIFILIFNIPHLLLRYNLTFWGYNAGTKFLRNLAKSNVMDKLTTLMAITTPITIGSSKSAITVQGILDQIVPAIIPLGLTFLVYYFVRKNVKTTYLLLGLLVLGFVGSMIHLFA